jgi:undecaprenyl-diphosphatase
LAVGWFLTLSGRAAQPRGFDSIGGDVSGLEALLLGFVRGLGEFLPVSSSGHLVILQVLLGARPPGLPFEVAVQLATLGSVLVFYRRRLLALSTGYVAKLGLATLPALLVIWLAGDSLEQRFEPARSAAVGLLVTGGLLWTTRRTPGRARLPEPGWGAALLIGCAQALVILPGISRSGVTVSVALALGVAPTAAAEFAFLMGVVSIAGAALRCAPELGAVAPEHATALLLGSGAALICGITAIWAVVRTLRARVFHRFAYYTWTVGLLALVLLARG